MSTFGKMYKDEIVGQMQTKFGYKNMNMIPKIEKVVVNCCTRDAVTNGKVVDSVVKDLTAITGQKPIITRAKKSIAGFKLREGQAIGAAVTLRGEMMYEFLERLICITLPRVRDFRGVNEKSFDGKGNYTLGLKEQIIFPEIDYDKIDNVRGVGISIVTTAKNNDEGRELLGMFGMPFKGKNKEL
jgi:large subunit ribosomal protein L5